MELTPKTPKTPKKTPKGKWIRYKWPSRPEVFEAFTKWTAYPKSVRNPKNQQGFAKLHEVSPDTLSDYKKRAEFLEKVHKYEESIKEDIENSLLLDQIFKNQKS